ncbi:MAG: hypothetical protein NTV34_19790 [Proteobacteria bacterium]|nr:hypothetical protein [Pseudomonadota bacterium]
MSLRSLRGHASAIPTKVKVAAKSNYIAPHIGWFGIWEPGFTIGLVLGWLIPSGATSSSEISFASPADDARGGDRKAA